MRAVLDAVEADEALALAEVGVGSEAPSQLLMQRSQSVQRTGSRSILQSENRLKMPSKAPSGQRARQKNRGIHQLATSKPMKIRPTTQACQYSRGSV